jgi:hypothetical protein
VTPEAEREIEEFRMHLAKHSRRTPEPACRFCIERSRKMDQTANGSPLPPDAVT